MRSVGADLAGVGHDGSAVGGDPVEVLRLRAREASVASARLLAAVLAVADVAVPGFDADEVAFALAWTQVAARRQVEFARYLIGVLPAVFAAMACWDIDPARGWVFYDQLATVDDGLAASIADGLVPVAPGLTTSQLRDRLRRAVLNADPDAAAARTRRSEAGRYVASTPDGDGTASLVGVRLPAGRSVAAFERVDAYARARKRDGDLRTLDQLRADTFLDLLEGVGIGASPVHRAGVIELVVPWATAVGLGDQPGTLSGYGPVAAAITRDLIAGYGQAATSGTGVAGTTRVAAPRPGRTRTGTRWCYSVTAPDGTLLMHGITRPRTAIPTPPDADTLPAARPAAPATGVPPVASPRPPVEADSGRRIPSTPLARWIVTRDRTCRAPGCRTPAHSTDIDHTTDHHNGGPTSHTNLAALCRHHHRTKHNAGWTVTQPNPGHLVWTSPTGHTYQRDPDPPW